MNTRARLNIVLVCLLGFFLYAASRCQARPAQTTTAKNSAQAQPTPGSESEEGEKLFRTNCGRCHNPPEDLSPREARAVLRQMRVRAMLSAEDERLILKYIAP